MEIRTMLVLWKRSSCVAAWSGPKGPSAAKQLQLQPVMATAKKDCASVNKATREGKKERRMQGRFILDSVNHSGRRVES